MFGGEESWQREKRGKEGRGRRKGGKGREGTGGERGENREDRKRRIEMLWDASGIIRVKRKCQIIYCPYDLAELGLVLGLSSNLKKCSIVLPSTESKRPV